MIFFDFLLLAILVRSVKDFEILSIFRFSVPVFPLSMRRRQRQKKVEKKDLQLGEGPQGRLARLRRARRPRRARLRGVLKDFFDF